jgi:hypothetical protein
MADPGRLADPKGMKRAGGMHFLPALSFVYRLALSFIYI